METPTLKLNSKLQEYLNLPADDQRRKSSFKSTRCCNFRYPDGTESITVNQNEELQVGDDFRDFIKGGTLRVITEIVLYRPHRGVYTDESKRQRIAIVRSELVPGV